MPIVNLNATRLFNLIKWWHEEGWRKHADKELWPYPLQCGEPDPRNDLVEWQIMAQDIMNELYKPEPTYLGCGCLLGTHDNTMEAMKENHKDIVFPELDPKSSYFFTYLGTTR